MKFNWRLFGGVATMTGMIIGAGFLGMPYVIVQSGFLIGLIQIVLIGFALLVMKLYLGEILLRTEKTHQLPGLAKIYLGKWGGKIMFYSMILGIYLSVIAYLLGEGDSLSYLFFGNYDYALYFAFGFWVLISFFVYHGIRALKKGESMGLIFVITILFLILILFAGKIEINNLSIYNPSNAFIPVGVIMYALLGFSAIPEALRVLRRRENLLKKAIFFATLTPIVIYTLFTFVVIGVRGAETPEIATLALGRPFIILGILTMFTAYFGLTMALRDIYRFDLRYKKFKAWFLACFVPFFLYLAVYLFDLASFIEIIGFAGAIFGTINGVMVLLMVRKARKTGKRKPEYVLRLPPWVIWILITVLILGLGFQLIF
jgi:amino acid transporter